MLELLDLFVIDKHTNISYNINNSKLRLSILGGATYRRNKMTNDRQARETFIREWRELISEKEYYEDETFYREIAWEEISRYWRRECTRLRKSRRDAIVKWCVVRLQNCKPISSDRFRQTVRELVDEAIWEA